MSRVTCCGGFACCAASSRAAPPARGTELRRSRHWLQCLEVRVSPRGAWPPAGRPCAMLPRIQERDSLRSGCEAWLASHTDSSSGSSSSGSRDCARVRVYVLAASRWPRAQAAWYKSTSWMFCNLLHHLSFSSAPEKNSRHEFGGSFTSITCDSSALSGGLT